MKELYVKPTLAEMTLTSDNTICSCLDKEITLTDLNTCDMPDNIRFMAMKGAITFGSDSDCLNPAEFCVFTSASTLSGS